MQSTEYVPVKLYSQTEGPWLKIEGRPWKNDIKSKFILGEPDLYIPIYEKERVESIATILSTESSIRGLLYKTPVKFEVRLELLIPWMKEQKERRIHRLLAVRKIDKDLEAMSNYLDKQEELRAQVEKYQGVTYSKKPDMIESMEKINWEESILAARGWIQFIQIAQRDFLHYHGRHDRENFVDYISARSLIFDNDYRIYWDAPAEELTKPPKYINLEELLELVVAVLQSADRILKDSQEEEGSVWYSIEAFRAMTAKLSQDPALIDTYCKK